MTNLFYFRNLNSVGGTETFLYYIAKKYSATCDITIVYMSADVQQLIRLSKYVKCIKYTGQKFKCKKAFFSYNLEIIDHVEAEEYYAIAHTDYINYPNASPMQHPKITKYIGVSDVVTDALNILLPGKDIQRIYNPLVPDQPQKTLLLVSATRLSKEKGKSTMEQLACKLDENGRPWIWLVFTTDKIKISNPNIAYLPPSLNVIDYINKCDYLVQLSDVEGYGYSVAEALSIEKPVIVTDIPVMHEIGVKDGVNGFILKKDLSNVDVNKFYDNTLLFSYTPPKDEWDKVLVRGERKEMSNEMKAKIKAKRKYTDTQLNQDIIKGHEYIVTLERAEQIVRAGYAEIIETIDEPDIKTAVPKVAKRNAKSK